MSILQLREEEPQDADAIDEVTLAAFTGRPSSLRFGFQVVPGLTYAGGPADHFQALSFTGAHPRGEVEHSLAFEARSAP